MLAFAKVIKSRDITLLTKAFTAKTMVFPVVMYGYESCTVKKGEYQRTDAFELWCWRRLLRVSWTTRRSNQSILTEINPEYSLEGLVLKLKLQYFDHLMWRANLLEKTLMLGKIEARAEGNNGGWDGWMASLNQWTWVWISSGRWWRVAKPCVLQSFGTQGVGLDWATEQQQKLSVFSLIICSDSSIANIFTLIFMTHFELMCLYGIRLRLKLIYNIQYFLHGLLKRHHLLKFTFTLDFIILTVMHLNLVFLASRLFSPVAMFYLRGSSWPGHSLLHQQGDSLPWCRLDSPLSFNFNVTSQQQLYHNIKHIGEKLFSSFRWKFCVSVNRQSNFTEIIIVPVPRCIWKAIKNQRGG